MESCYRLPHEIEHMTILQWLGILCALRAKKEKRPLGSIAINTADPNGVERAVKEYESRNTVDRAIQWAEKRVESLPKRKRR